MAKRLSDRGYQISQLRRSLVWLAGRSGYLGTGFFVAPGIVATCAHVAGTADYCVWPDRGNVRISIKSRRLFPAEPGHGDFYDFPDVALINVDDREQSLWLPLRDDEPAAGTAVKALGFSTATPLSGVHDDTLLLTIVGTSGRFLRVKDDQVIPGFSGSPVLDQKTGSVCGMIKATRGQDGALGGWIIPSSVIRELISSHYPHAARRIQFASTLLTPLRDLLRAQRLAGEQTPYPLRMPNAPRLPSLYVRQRVQPVAGSEIDSDRARLAEFDQDMDPLSVADALKSTQNCVIIGAPGVGKSTLLRHVAAASADWWLAAHDHGSTDRGDAPYGLVLPVQVLAKQLVRVPVRETITAAIGAAWDTLALMPGMRDAEWLILIDGLDEILIADDLRLVIDALADELADPELPYRLIITSRPLPRGSLDLLRQGDTTEYELCHFSPSDLTRFAERWFATAGKSNEVRSARRFVEQIERARLDAIVTVPLLATIAVMVYQDADGQQLPTSRAGLYDRFVRYLLQEREPLVRTRETLRQRLGAFTARGEAFADWLFDHRRTLLEYLACQHIAGDTRPFGVLAADYLSPRGPAPVDLIPDWPDVVTSLLLSTGVMVQEKDEIRFLHHSFAEYLAAIPSGFPGPNRWIERALDPARHNLAMFELDRWSLEPGHSADQLAAKLAGGGRVHVLLAGEILASGVEVRPETEELVVASLLRHLRNPRFASVDVLSVLAALRGRASVTNGLRELVTDPRADKVCRVRAADLQASGLLGTGEDREAGLAALRAIADDKTANAYGRVRAIHALVRLGQHGERADSLRFLAASGDIPGFIRVRASEALIAVGDLDAGVTLLRDIAHDSNISTSTRISAAQALIEAGERTTGAAILSELACARDSELDDRIEAGRILIDVGDRKTGVDVLRELISSVSDRERVLIARELIEAGEHEIGIPVVLGLINRVPIDLTVRAHAAGVLVDCGHRDVGMPVLRLAALSRPAVAWRLARQSVRAVLHALVNPQSLHILPPRDRAMCAWRLVRLGDRTSGLRVLRRLARRRSVPARDQVWIAQLLLDVGEPGTAMRTLTRITTRSGRGAAASTVGRLDAARTLTELGEHDIGTEILGSVASDSTAPIDDRFEAVTALLDLGETLLGLQALQQLTADDDDRVRMRAARILIERGQLVRGAGILDSLARDERVDIYIRVQSAADLIKCGRWATGQQTLISIVESSGDAAGIVGAAKVLIEHGHGSLAETGLRQLIVSTKASELHREEAVKLLASTSGPANVAQLMRNIMNAGSSYLSSIRGWAAELLIIAADSVESGSELLYTLTRDVKVDNPDLGRAAQALALCYGHDPLLAFLHQVSADDTVDPRRRAWAAREWMRHRDAAGLAIIRRILADPRLTSDQRCDIIDVIADLPDSDTAISELTDIATNNRHSPRECARALKVLARVADRDVVINVIHEIITDPKCTIVKRVDAAEIMARIGDRRKAMTTLRAIVEQCEVNDLPRRRYALDALQRVNSIKGAQQRNNQAM